MKTHRLTMAQALVRHLAALQVQMADGSTQTYIAGVFGIFGHGNVAGLGEALAAQRDSLPTWRAHNEQAMARWRNCALPKAMAAWAIACSLCARQVGRLTRCPASASPSPATLPWPKMPNTPAM